MRSRFLWRSWTPGPVFTRWTGPALLTGCVFIVIVIAITIVYTISTIVCIGMPSSLSSSSLLSPVFYSNRPYHFEIWEDFHKTWSQAHVDKITSIDDFSWIPALEEWHGPKVGKPGVVRAQNTMPPPPKKKKNKQTNTSTTLNGVG